MQYLWYRRYRSPRYRRYGTEALTLTLLQLSDVMKHHVVLVTLATRASKDGV